MNDEINEKLDDLADLAAIWASRRENDRPAPLIKDLMIRACVEVHDAVVPRISFRDELGDFSNMVDFKEVDDWLDDLADLAAIWAERRKAEKPVAMVRDFMLLVCRELCDKSRVPTIRAWVKGQFDSVDVP